MICKRTKALPHHSADETVDTLFQGHLAVIQSKRGYRFSLDAVLLAHFLGVRDGEKVADLGTGNAVIPLILCFLRPAVQAVGVEIQEAMVERALRSAVWNGLNQRMRVIQGDVCSIEGILPRQGFDAVVCNPPYRRLKSGRINPDLERSVARHEVRGSLGQFLHAASYLLRHRGKVAMIYPAKRAVDLMEVMRREGMEPKRLRWVHSFRSAEATLVLVEAIKGGTSELLVVPPLVVYERPGIYSADVRAMLKE